MRSAILLGLFALSGCASAPGYRSSAIDVPASFRQASDSDAATPQSARKTSSPVAPAQPVRLSLEYWEQLGDTTLSRLMHELLAANQDIQVAQAHLSNARSEHARAVLDFTPSTLLSGGYVRQRLASATFPGVNGVFPDQNVWSVGLDAAWELDVFGRTRQNVQAHGAMVGAAEEDLRNAQVTLTAELARAYFVLRGAQDQLEVAQRNADNQRHTFDVTRERLAAGRGSTFDTERAQAQLSLTLASIPTREVEVALAQYRIGVLVGRPPAQLAQELAQPGPMPTFPEVTSVGNPESVVRNRPDVASAERVEAAQRALVGVAKANYMPRVTIGGSLGYAASEFNTLGDQGMGRYAIGPIITWPLLNLGRVKAEVDAAQANEGAARAQYDQMVLEALEDIESSLTRYRSARERVERLQDASTASERAAELARLRFREGMTDLLQVLDAERTQLEAQDRLALGRIDEATSFAALYKAVGAGAEPRDGER